ncbi:MAG: PQQ-binding-like beta-propeller repeat protein [Gammaproteobacteria bacterium]
MGSLFSGGAALIAVLVAGFGGADVASPPNTNWLSYNYNINGQRYVPLTQINKENVSRLGPVCQLKVEELGSFHTGILHVDGALYFTTPTDTLAIDSADCSVIWRHHHEEQELEITALRVNRGVAYANGVLYRGTVDSYLIAIDAKTGKTIWQQQVGDSHVAEFLSAAPQYYQGLIIIGTAGSDWGIRGRVMAFDANTGREVWRFYTIPRGDEVGSKSWINADSAQTGGGGTWTTYTLDLSAGEVFIPVGNPAPDMLPEKRPGENLFTNTLVVLDANTGKLKWYHQVLSNDGQDLDLAAAPTLYYNKEGERMVAFGSKDGHAYGINRETQKRVFKTEITTIKNSGVVPTVEGIEICPGVLGGVEWNGAAFDKPNHSIIIGTVDWCATIAADPNFKYEPGNFYFAGTFEMLADGKGWIHALDADTGQVKWKRQMQAPQVAGITVTAAGLVISGDMGGNFMALDSQTGAELYKSKVSGGLAGGVITYMRDEKQYIAFASGNVSRLTFGNIGSPTLNIYALDGKAKIAEAQPAPTTVAASTADVTAGKLTYGQVCAMCHGVKGEGALGPKLSGIKDRMNHERIVEWIKNPSDKMPKLYPSMLDEQKVTDVAAYLEKL